MKAEVCQPIAPETYRPKPRLYQMQPGHLFFFRPTNGAELGLPDAAVHGVLTLLSRNGEVVADSQKIWCVVVAVQPDYGVAGEFIGLPREALVERVRVVTGLGLAREH